jgi:hypothetical protein
MPLLYPFHDKLASNKIKRNIFIYDLLPDTNDPNANQGRGIAGKRRYRDAKKGACTCFSSCQTQ